MAGNVNANTLFHLVPLSEAAHDALSHPDNNHFVSLCSIRGQILPALEIGFHVPLKPSAPVITRLGRDADLTLRGRAVSKVHVAFEINPHTHVVLLSIRSKRSSSVQLSVRSKHLREHDRPLDSSKSWNPPLQVDRECVIAYKQMYRIKILPYDFVLQWRDETVEALRDLAIRGYRDTLQQVIRSRDLPTEFDASELQTWHNTRLQTVGRVLFREAEEQFRVPIGNGTFGNVYRTLDLESGNPVAVKVVNLSHYTTTDQQEWARAHLHREIKALQTFKHNNIVECLSTAKWDTLTPEIFMPLRSGTLRSLARDNGRPCTDDALCFQVLEQILSALDYLAHHGMCHRDVKPENILYWNSKNQGQYNFQLADFGLVNHQRLANTFCGTNLYQAPELHPQYGNFPQSPKMDVWSLFVTIMDVHKGAAFPPSDVTSYDPILRAVRAAVVLVPRLGHMARENPTYRASAAQMLVHLFGGRGLTTPRTEVPPIDPRPEDQGPNVRMPLRTAQTPAAVPQPSVEAPVVLPLTVGRPHRRQRTQEHGSDNSVSSARRKPAEGQPAEDEDVDMPDYF